MAPPPPSDVAEGDASDGPRSPLLAVAADESAADKKAGAEQSSQQQETAAAAAATGALSSVPVVAGPLLSHTPRASGRSGRRPPSRRANAATAAAAHTDAAAMEGLRERREQLVQEQKEELAAMNKATAAAGAHSAVGDEMDDTEGTSRPRKGSSGTPMFGAGSKALMGELSGVLLKKTSSNNREDSTATRISAAGSGSESTAQPEWMTKLKSKRDEGSVDDRSGSVGSGTPAKDAPSPLSSHI